MKKLYCSLLLLSFSLSLLPGCGRKTSQRPAPPIPKVVVDTVVEKEIQLYLESPTGRTEASQYVSVPARVSGFLEQIKFIPGQMVQEGQPLFLIEQADYIASLNAAEAQLKVTEAKSMLAKANLDRAQTLIESKTITVEEFQTISAIYKESQAQIEAAKAAIDRAKLFLSYTEINSPVSGKTGPNLVDQGNLVGPGSDKISLVTIAKLDPLYVYFDISDVEFNAFMLAQHQQREEAGTNGNLFSENEMNIPFTVTILSSTTVGENKRTYEGMIKLADNKIDRSTGTITLRGELPNPEYLVFPGQACRVQIPFGKDGSNGKQMSLLIREEAINTDLNAKFVLTVDKDNIVHRCDVQIGDILDDRMRIILSGLQPGETYIYEGIQRARRDDPVDPMTADEYEDMINNITKPVATP